MIVKIRGRILLVILVWVDAAILQVIRVEAIQIALQIAIWSVIIWRAPAVIINRLKWNETELKKNLQFKKTSTKIVM